jgi:hypothetical protein
MRLDIPWGGAGFGTLETAIYLVIARDCRRIVVAIDIHGGHPEFPGEARNFEARIAVAHDQAAAHGAQGGIDFLDGAQDELDAPIAARQRLKDADVEDKNAMHPVMALQGVVQGSVILHAQVAAKPDQGR